MKAASNRPGQVKVSPKLLQKVLADGTRWRIFDVLHKNGPLTTEYIVQAVKGTLDSVSKHLVFLREAGLLEHRMRRLYAIPEHFKVPGERALDFGWIVLRFDQET